MLACTVEPLNIDCGKSLVLGTLGAPQCQSEAARNG